MFRSAGEARVLRPFFKQNDIKKPGNEVTKVPPSPLIARLLLRLGCLVDVVEKLGGFVEMKTNFLAPGNEALRALTPVLKEFVVMVAAHAHPVTFHLRGHA